MAPHVACLFQPLEHFLLKILVADRFHNSTVLYLSLAYVQGSQAFTLFPVVEASKFVAGETLLALAGDPGGNTASAVAR